MSTNTVQPSEAAKRGLKLLSSSNRKLNPRAQIKSLRLSAVRAANKADWLLELEDRYGAEYAADRTKVAALRAKASDAIEACLYLNTAHSLGFPVPSASNNER